METLITTTDIKELTSISKQVEPAELEPYISIAQRWYCNDILGISLLTELNSQITGNSISVLNNTLLNDYIKPLIAYASWLEASEFLEKKTTNKGVKRKTSINSESLDEDSFVKYQNKIKANVTQFQADLKCYLEDNKDKYPLYRSNNNTTYASGIYLGRELNRRDRY